MNHLRAPQVTAAAGETRRLPRRGLWLEYASIAWMTAEAVIAITAGLLARSIALTGFGRFFAADLDAGAQPAPTRSGV